MPSNAGTATSAARRASKLERFLDLAGEEARHLFGGMLSTGYVLIPGNRLMERDGSIRLGNGSHILALNFFFSEFKKLTPVQDFRYSRGVKLEVSTLPFTHRSINTWWHKLREEGLDIPTAPIFQRRDGILRYVGRYQGQ